MKNKLLVLFLLLSICGYSQSVPDTNTFSLQDVYDVVHSHASGTTPDLQSCINNAVGSYYDPTYYTAPATSLYEFRNYTVSPCILATLSTTSISNITASTASSGGNITSDGGCAVTARGVCWSTSTSPTISNSHTTDGSGTGSFTSNLTGLTASTTYYVRAYATNSTGTAYGNQVSFTTSDCTPTLSHAAFSKTFLPGSPPPVALTGSTSIYLNNIFYNYSGAAYATLVIESINLDYDGDGNTFGVIQDNGTTITSFPHSVDITGLSSTGLTTLSQYFNDPNGTILTGYPIQSITYTFHVVDINGCSSASTTSKIYTLAYYNTLTSISSITSTTAFVNGGGWATSFGGCGYYYGTNPAVSFTDTKIETRTTSGGTYSNSLTGLTPGTTYYARAYIVVGSSTILGGTTKSFTTLP